MKNIINETSIQKNKLTLFEIGVTAHYDDNNGYMDGEDWWFGKLGGVDNAINLVNKIWNTDKTNDVLKKIDVSKDTVLITVPSTSGTNIIPISLARKISLDIKSTYYDGSQFYTIMHDIEMKGVDPRERVFTQRKYILNSKNCLHVLFNKNIIIVEDVVLTGSSIFSFIRALKRDGIQATTIVTLFGDPHLTAQFEQITYLNRLISDTKIGFNHKIFGSLFSKGEINKLIEIISEFDEKDKKYAFARRIQRLLDTRIAEFMGQNSCPRDKRNRKPEGVGDEPVSIRIQTLPNIMALRRPGFVQGAREDCSKTDFGVESKTCEEGIEQQEDSSFLTQTSDDDERPCP